MKITTLKIENIRGFKGVFDIPLSDTINIFIGSNNTGKSTLLNSVFLLQKVDALTNGDVTLGSGTGGTVELYYKNSHRPYIEPVGEYNRFVFDIRTNRRFLGSARGYGRVDWQTIIPSKEPDNIIYPYLSKRKTTEYVSVINETNANSVSGNFSNLFSKIDRLVTPQFQPANSEYIRACNKILGFEISTLAKDGGKKAVYFVHNLEHIPLTSMGEGVANILGLITDLCIAKDRIFIIEELENDIHPKALKALLELIIEKSLTNQFFISTHSNIVMKYLGGAYNSKVFNVTNNERDSLKPNLFISKVTEVSNEPEERRQILEDLGYDFFDFDLWKGWLFLEESSAEIIIRDYLIEWFVPSLKNKIRTFSASGTSNIISKFEDFDKLFIFLHLEPTYKNKVWVLIDAGDEELSIINKMKEKYVKSGWSESNFNQFSEHDFEKYYPEQFQSKVVHIISIKDRQEKRRAKRELLNQVKDWILSDKDAAKEQFKESAKEVVDKLKAINKELNR